MATPTIAMIPSGYKSGKVYSVLPTDGTGDLTFTRASSATRVNQSGLIETVATGVPRLDYTGGGCPSLLLEPQSTNLITYSEDFSNAAWTKSNTTVTSSLITSPSGEASSYLLKGDGVSSFPRVVTSVSSSGVISVSLFVKKELSDDVVLFLTGTGIGGAGSSSAYRYTFSTDTVSKESGGDINSSSSKSYSNGWVRIELNYTTTTVTDFRVYPKYNTTSTDGVYIYGAQLEQQSYATSYVPTAGATATRIADAASKTGLSSYINSTEGVLYFECSALADDGTNRYLSIDDGTTNNYIYFRYVSISNTVLMRTVVGGVTINTIQVAVADTTIYNKFAFKWKSGDYAFWINGVEGGTDTSATIFPANTLNNLGMNFPASTGGFNANTKSLQVYKTALTDAELITLTTI